MTPISRRNVLAAAGVGGVIAALNESMTLPVKSSEISAVRRGKIALEEHFSIRDLMPNAKELTFFDPDTLALIDPLLPELAEQRLAAMDAAGIQLSVLSQTGPGVQGVSNRSEATELAIRSNNTLWKAVQENPTRFRGFAAVNLLDVNAACQELKRCIQELGFVGVLINGSTKGLYLDDPGLNLFWQTLEELKVPLYLHPGIPTNHPASMVDELEGATWEWSFDTATQALRLIMKNIFERHPEAKVILGHMGENLPFYLWRLDSRFEITRYRSNLSAKPSDIFKKHFYITTSGVCDDAALKCSIDSIGANRIMFATDYPYEDIDFASRWIEAANIDDKAKAQICYSNAERILKLY